MLTVPLYVSAALDRIRVPRVDTEFVGQCLLGISLMLAFAGCQTQDLRLTAKQERVRAELQRIAPTRDPLAASSPIIDIHTHTFNARYLPLHGILLGKRDAFPPITWLISDRCAQTLSHALIERTEIAAAAGQGALARYDKPHFHTGGDHGLVCRVFLSLLDKAAAAGVWTKGMSSTEQMRQLDRVADTMTFQERMAVRAAAHMMGMEERMENADQRSALRGAVRFLWLLTQNDAEMTRLFRLEYAGAPMRGRPLMVSHMIDLAPVYNQRADNSELLDFAKQQVQRAEEFQNRPGSGMIYFVAYNPYRDHWMGERPGDALRLVRSAIQEHGAWGVKVYPPSGYRPAGNKIKSRATAILTRYPGEQWDARYSDLGTNKNATLDRRLEELLLWCIANDVPVFVHCGTGEFEARKGYGIYNSNPRFWRRFLEKHPAADGSPCRLRLCLGHAGGGDFWFGGTKQPDWGKEVYDLCREFPNVYCEITTHAELVNPQKQAYFVDQLAMRFDESSQSGERGRRYRYPFSKKLMYGTDWYLPDAKERRDILLATEQAFLHPKLRVHYKDYFFRNALRYLNVQSRLRDKRLPIPPAVRERLNQALLLSQR